MRTALIDYGSGNLASAAKALARAASDTGQEIVTTADPEIVLNAERIVLPRGDRQAVVDGYVTRYAERLEAWARRDPLQWYNFFDFWAQ